MAMSKIERIDREIQKTREKITDYQNKLKGLEAQKTEAENLEIVQLVRSMRLTPAELMSRLGRNYLQVGFYTEILFPQKDVRFLAINNSVQRIVVIRQGRIRRKPTEKRKKAITITVSVYVLCVAVPTGLHTVSRNSAPRNVKR